MTLVKVQLGHINCLSIHVKETRVPEQGPDVKPSGHLSERAVHAILWHEFELDDDVSLKVVDGLLKEF